MKGFGNIGLKFIQTHNFQEMSEILCEDIFREKGLRKYKTFWNLVRIQFERRDIFVWRVLKVNILIMKNLFLTSQYKLPHYQIFALVNIITVIHWPAKIVDSFIAGNIILNQIYVHLLIFVENGLTLIPHWNFMKI